MAEETNIVYSAATRGPENNAQLDYQELNTMVL